MAQCVLFLALVASAGAASDARASRGFLAADMQPAVVAEKLVGVEDGWEAAVDRYIRCNTTGPADVEGCAGNIADFAKSCGVVVNAMIQGSSGQEDVVHEYMGAVCGSAPLKDWRQVECQSLAAIVDGKMSADAYNNREELNVTGVCQEFWTHVVADRSVRVHQELEKKAAEEKKRAEEAEAEQKKFEAEQAMAKAAAASEAAERAKARAEAATRALANSTAVHGNTSAAVAQHANTTAAAAPSANATEKSAAAAAPTNSTPSMNASEHIAPIVNAFAAASKLPSVRSKLALTENKTSTKKWGDRGTEAQMAPIVNAFAAAAKMPSMRKRMALNQNNTATGATKKLSSEEQIAPIVKAFAAAARMPAIKKRMP